MREELDRAENEIARIAGRQHGVITVEQLRVVGIEKNGVTRRVRSGRLHRLHRGIYAVGHLSPNEWQRYMAAVLACGEGAALSHQSAAYLFGFLKPEGGSVHVTSPSTSGKALRAGIVLHRSPSLGREGEVTRRERIPVTTPSRTIENLKSTLPDYLVRRARPEVNVRVGKYTVDFLWPVQMLAVETDFFDYHRGHQVFEDDHQRELDLRRLGYVVRRFTGAQIRDHPALVVADLGEVLSRPPERGLEGPPPGIT